MFARRIRGLFKPEPMRRIRWILVANRSSARIFQQSTDTPRLEMVRRLEHSDQGRLLLGELNADRPKASELSEVPEAILRHAKSVQTSDADDEAKRFAKTLDIELRKARQEKRFHELIIAAEPGYLGTLLNQLDRGTLGMVVDRVHKDLASFSDARVVRYFDEDWRRHERYRNAKSVNQG